MSNFIVGCSPFTSKIYAGKILNDGSWDEGKQDVTESAPAAVAQRLLQLDQKMQFDHRGKIFELKVELAAGNGVEIIAEERRRQIEVEGWTPEHDAQHTDESIAYAAACYAIPHNGRNIFAGQGGLSDIFHLLWPWAKSWWKPSPDDRIKELAKAGALIAAEIDRLIAIGK